MAKLLKLRRGSTSQHASFTGAEGEVTIDTTKDTAVVHNGAQAGGKPLAKEDMSNVSSASIVGQIGTSAIAGTKVSPNFGSQNITTTGNITSSNLTLSDNDPELIFTDLNNNPDYKIKAESGILSFRDITNGNVARLMITASGSVKVFDNLDVGAGLDVTGNMTVTGTVDGRDVAADGTKLDGIESGATADQTSTEIKSLLASDNLTAAHLAANSVGSSELANNAVDTAAIAADAVSLGKLQNISANHILGRVTSGTGDIGLLNATQLRTLINVENGATADQSASEILTAIKTVDGSGSGLDADSVDGIHASAILRSDTSDTASGDITFAGAAGAVTIAAGSDIRGTSGNWTGEAPTSGGKLQWHGNNLYIQTYTSNIFRNSSGSNTFVVDSSGNATATGNVTAYSDARLKTNVNTINDALSIVGKLRGVSFDWKESGKHSIGVIAQEVEKVIPEVVLTSDNLDPATGETTEVKSVDYGKIVGVLINAINELKAEVDELKGGK